MKKAKGTGSIPPELEGPRWRYLALPTLRRNAREFEGLEVGAKTLKSAYAEVLEALRARGEDLSYSCGRCNSPINATSPRCWACGAVLGDDEGEPALSLEELRSRARNLGVSTRGRDADSLRAAVEEAERRRRERKRDGDLGGIEAKEIIRRLKEDLPDGWKPRENPRYVAFFDPEGVRRLAVKFRGLYLQFNVDDDFFEREKVPGLLHLDREERRKRHFGRTNWVYVGDLQKTALELARRVFEAYGGGGR